MPSLLDGVRVIEVAMFAPDALGMHLADLGAEVIKVEAPGIGDPARLLGHPYRGEAPATLRWNRGKYSITLDLRSPAGADVFRDLVADADAVVEGMRPGALERRGLGPAALRRVNPRLVFASVSGWGLTGPYRDLGAHGLAFDAFAGLAPPRSVAGHPTRPTGHIWQGLEAAPLYAAMAVVSGILRARTSGEPATIEVSQADAGAVWNGWQIAYARAVAEHGIDPETPDTRELVHALESSAEGGGETGATDPTASDVRYQYYATRDGMLLFMATESRFWKNFCHATDRMDLFDRWPGQGYADHDYGNEPLRKELSQLFATRTTADWVRVFIDHDVAGAPVYEAGQVHQDEHFQARELWVDPAVHGLQILGSPVRVEGAPAVSERRAPAAGADTDHILREILRYDAARIDALRAAGALGSDT